MSTLPFTRLRPSPVLGAGLLVVASVLIIAAYRHPAPASAVPAAAVSAERQLRFVDRADGGVDALDLRHPERSQELAAPDGRDGFVRATLRSLARERQRLGVGDGPPFVLQRLTDGRLLLQDPSTGRSIDLEAFGPTNTQRFARLLPPAPSGKVTP